MKHAMNSGSKFLSLEKYWFCPHNIHIIFKSLPRGCVWKRNRSKFD